MRTRDALGSPGNRDAGATVKRNRFAGRAAAALLALAGLAGCDPRQVGNGVYAERTVPVGDFAGVRMQDGLHAEITVAPGLAQTVVLTGDENIIENNIQTSLEVDGVGSTAVTVLRVWASPSFTPVIPPRVVIRRPTLLRARASEGSVVEVARPAGSAAVGGPLGVELETAATLSARGYPVLGAVVELDGGSSALLHSDGPVTGTVSGNSHLDNTFGMGPCLVTTTAGSTVACNAYE